MNKTSVIIQNLSICKHTVGDFGCKQLKIQARELDYTCKRQSYWIDRKHDWQLGWEVLLSHIFRVAGSILTSCYCLRWGRILTRTMFSKKKYILDSVTMRCSYNMWCYVQGLRFNEKYVLVCFDLFDCFMTDDIVPIVTGKISHRP